MLKTGTAICQTTEAELTNITNKPMTIEEAIKFLQEYNEWRRGSVLEQPHPTEIGIALDIVLNAMEFLTKPKQP